MINGDREARLGNQEAGKNSVLNTRKLARLVPRPWLGMRARVDLWRKLEYDVSLLLQG